MVATKLDEIKRRRAAHRNRKSSVANLPIECEGDNDASKLPKMKPSYVYNARGQENHNGMVPDVAYNFLVSVNPRSDERTLHNLLQSSNVNGEWFNNDARPDPLTRYGPLFGNKPTMASRSRQGEEDYYWLSKNALCRFIDVYGTLTYRVAWEQIKSGAVIYDADGPHSRPEVLSDFERYLLPYLDPVDKTPTRESELYTVINTNLFANDYNSSDNTVLEKSMSNAKKWTKCVKVMLGNKDTFVAISEDEAMQAFTNIFGEGKTELAVQFCHS